MALNHLNQYKPTFYIPENLDLRSILGEYEPDWVKHIDKFHYLVDKLYTTKFLDKRYSLESNQENTSSTSLLTYTSYGVTFPQVKPVYSHLTHEEKRESKRKYVNLNMNMIRNVLNTRFTRTVMDTLFDLKIIETDNQYIPKIKSKGYRLRIPYHSQPFKEYSVFDNKFLIKLKRIREEEINTLNNVHRWLYENLYSFSFDIQQAQSIINSLSLTVDEHIGLALSIDKIVNKDIFFSTDCKTGRVFHNFGNIKREFRDCIKDSDGNSLVEIDISNSQPFFLGLLLVGNNVNGIDVERYKEITKNGHLYDFFCQKYSLERDYVKKQLLTLFFCKNHWEFKLKDIFISEFPTVYTFIENIKEEDNSKLAIILQRLEARTIIDSVSPILLQDNVKFITVHDSIMCAEKDCETVKKTMEVVFQNRYGIIPSLRIKE